MEENYIWPEITKETTLEEVREIHRRIWDYVIEHGEKPSTPYDFDCVLCKYSRVHRDLGEYGPDSGFRSKCSFCPAIWDGICCESKGSEYIKWGYCSGKEKKYWAKRVRDIPFEEG